MSRILHIIRSLSFREKKKFWFIIFLSCLSSLSDLAGVISIFPFLAVLSDNSIIFNNNHINALYQYFNLEINKFLIILGILSLIILTINQFLRVISNWYLNLFFEEYYFNTASRAYLKLLKKNYAFHIKANSTVISQKILVQIGNVVTGYLSPLLMIVVSSITTIFILIFLFFYNFELTIFILITYCIYYALIIFLFKNRLNEYGKTIPNYFSNASKIVSDSFNGIKEIKLLRKEYFFKTRFDPILKNYNFARVKIFLFQSIPHSLLEIFSFLIVLIIVFFIFSPQNFSIIIPTLGILALALKRLQPTVTNIYNSIVQVKIYYPTFNDIYSEIFEDFTIKPNKKNIYKEKTLISFKDLELKNINFKYLENQNYILNNLHFMIKSKEKVGIFGESGSGKSTFVDILIGLLDSETGNIFVNGIQIKDCIINYQNKIGYASHNGYIFDGSFIENITLESHNENFDKDKILKILRLVCLIDFFESSLDNNFFSKIGENGYKLSTGQNQRLVLARMLYKNPEFIILDEATNALDKYTENIILNNIFNEFSNKTILMVSHDLKILEKCNKKYEFKNGNIKKVI